MNESDQDHMLTGVLDALFFAAKAHKDQRRKSSGEPYVNHLIEVAQLLASLADVQDQTTLQSAVLHDSVEDTVITGNELQERYGSEVLKLVLQLSDDKSQPKDVRKALTVDKIGSKDPRAQCIKIADLISNLRSLPDDWPTERQKQYLDWAKAVRNNISVQVPHKLDAMFLQTIEDAGEKLQSDFLLDR
jgi:guanosine-3',5'-bis(diphosphate) 3'-pyrophosphohydrolase